MGRLLKLKRQVIAEANKRVLNEELDKSLKDVVITGLQLKQAGYRKEDNRVVIYFDKNDLKEDIYLGRGNWDGDCEIEVEQKDGKIYLKDLKCWKTEEEVKDEEYPEFKNAVELRLDLPATTDHYHFSENILNHLRDL